MDRFELHCHSEYSNIRVIDSINRIPAVVDRAIEIGLKGVCLTDHETISGHIELMMYRDKIKDTYPDFKIGFGNEIYLVDERPTTDRHFHCILIAKDEIGHKQLRYLSSLAWLNASGKVVDTLKSDLDRVIREDKGHVVMTTACIGGEVSTSILRMETARKLGDTESAELNKKKIIDFILWAKELFGEDFYLEVAPAANKEQIIVNKKMAELSQVFGVKMVIGSDAHYLKSEDRYVHKAFLQSKEEDREVDSFYEYSYLQTEEQIKNNLLPSIVDLYEQMCMNSMEIYDKITEYSLAYPQQIPHVEVVNYDKKEFEKQYPTLYKMFKSDDKIERYWVNQCIDKLKELNKLNDTYLTRLEEEADIKMVISEKLNTNFFAYPVVLQHYINMFWECGSPVGAGRGSSCSGLNHYLLGVTQLDPIEWELPFWRYSNKERIELGDIDIDIAPSKRPMILNKIKEERGKKFKKDLDIQSKANLGCTLVATFGTETSKSVVQTACRGYRSEECPNGIDIDTSQYLSSLIPSERGFVWTLTDVVYGDKDKDRKPIQQFINKVNQYPGLLDIMFALEGIISKRGVHASGVILFDEDPYEHCCFMRSPSGEVCTQWDLHQSEWCGNTKYDYLVTSVQDKIAETIALLQADNVIDANLTLKEVYDQYLHPNIMPLDDVSIWKKIQNVEVMDLFQFDSLVGAQAAKKIQPSSMLELADSNGLMRLLPMETGETPMDKYIRFKNNIQLWYDEMTSYGLTKEEQESLKPHFLRSHGVPPSQEQLMTMLMDENVCSFSLKEANDARKIVGRL